MPDQFDLIIVGNGILGASVAFELQRREPGLQIAIVGPTARPGSATAAAGAMLNAFAELDAGMLAHPLHRYKFDLAHQATRAWPDWLEAVREAAGTSDGPAIAYGTYILKNMVADEQDDDAYRAIKAALAEFQEPHDIVTPKDIAGYAPAVTGRAIEAIYIPAEGSIQPRQLLATFDQAFARSKAVARIDGTAQQVNIGPGNQNLVRLTDGTEIRAPKILLANGAETGSLLKTIADLRDRIQPLFYGIGAALLLNIRVDAPPKVIRTPNRALAYGIHLVPQGKQQVYIGASNHISPWPEFSPRLTSVQLLIEGAIEQINSQYYNAQLEKIFLGFRPTSADTFPLIGQTSIEGLYMLTGTKRDGLHNSPVFARDMADRILKGQGFIDRFPPERKILRWLSKAEGIDLAIRHIRSAATQHGLQMPRSNWDPLVADMLLRNVEDVYQKSGIDYGIPPELLDMYRYGHVTNAH